MSADLGRRAGAGQRPAGGGWVLPDGEGEGKGGRTEFGGLLRESAAAGRLGVQGHNPAGGELPSVHRVGRRPGVHGAFAEGLWKMPFEVRLDDFTHEFHPGTRQPAEVSRACSPDRGRPRGAGPDQDERADAPEWADVLPGQLGTAGAAPGTPLFSVFEVVRNPADKWPEWSLYVVTLGLRSPFPAQAGFVPVSTSDARAKCLTRSQSRSLRWLVFAIRARAGWRRGVFRHGGRDAATPTSMAKVEEYKAWPESAMERRRRCRCRMAGG